MSDFPGPLETFWSSSFHTMFPLDSNYLEKTYEGWGNLQSFIAVFDAKVPLVVVNINLLSALREY